ncbi:SDR family oxidoreductase [Amorphus sp. 3PC139-8]
MDTGLANRLKGCRAAVSGGANGIGAAVVRRFRAEDASVLICDRDEDAGRALAEDTGAAFAGFNVTDIDALDRAMAAHGPFDILVNNVGVDQHAFLTDTRAEDWRRLLAINLESAFAFTRAVLPAMQAAGYGRIVTVSSEAGRLGSKGAAVYASAKGGLIAFAKSVARENARFAITSNVVLPGPVRTPLFEAAVAGGGDQILEAMKGATLLRRIGEPEEVASAVAFLASREAGFITGEVLGVSGGMGLG